MYGGTVWMESSLSTGVYVFRMEALVGGMSVLNEIKSLTVSRHMRVCVCVSVSAQIVCV